MTFTAKNQDQAARWARVAEMTASGEVMNSSRRTRLAKQQKAAQDLQDKADRVIASLQASQIASNRYKDISTAQPVEKVVPEPTTHLTANQKRDDLAATAAKVLEEILRG